MLEGILPAVFSVVGPILLTVSVIFPFAAGAVAFTMAREDWKWPIVLAVAPGLLAFTVLELGLGWCYLNFGFPPWMGWFLGPRH